MSGETFELIRNCGGCPHLVGVVSLCLPIYGCGKTAKKQIVPQATDRNREHPGVTTTVFTRVPLWCPLPDVRVQRSTDP